MPSPMATITLTTTNHTLIDKNQERSNHFTDDCSVMPSEYRFILQPKWQINRHFKDLSNWVCHFSASHAPEHSVQPFAFVFVSLHLFAGLLTRFILEYLIEIQIEFTQINRFVCKFRKCIETPNTFMITCTVNKTAAPCRRTYSLYSLRYTEPHVWLARIFTAFYSKWAQINASNLNEANFGCSQNQVCGAFESIAFSIAQDKQVIISS